MYHAIVRRRVRDLFDDVIAERSIQVDWIEQVLDWPELVEPDSDDPQLTHHVGRIQRYGNRARRVVLNSQATPVRIVTVFFDRKMKGRL
jgi:hypothetical protein